MNILATDHFLPSTPERRWRMEKGKIEHPLKILLVEDNKSDAMMIREMLYEATRNKGEDFHYELIRKELLRDTLDYLGENKVDVILLDLSLPDSRTKDTVRKVLHQEKNTPVVVLTGLDDETTAIEALQNGTQDYLSKNQVDSILLVRSIKYAIERFNNIREKEKLIKELQEALENVKTLSGLLPICASCKDIRTDEGYWIKVESYFKSRSDLNFTHGICPGCLKKLYPKYYDQKKECSEEGNKNANR
jgi:PleD family two-component response regulator